MADRACGSCEHELEAMIEMQPGLDGRRWYLCRRCYFDGVKPLALAGRDPTLRSSPTRRSRRG